MKVAMTCRFQMNLGAGGTKVSIREKACTAVLAGFLG